MRLNDGCISVVAVIPLLVLLLSAAAPGFAASPASDGSVSVGREEQGAALAPLSYSGGQSTFLDRLAAPDRKGGSVELASSYDPNFNITSLLATISALYDHGRLWDDVRSNSTVFKLEAVLGSMVRPEVRGVASVNMLALYYPELQTGHDYRPYLEAGIGVIYTDYRVPGQGLRLNFNPQAGVGMDIRSRHGVDYFMALRLHHISNGGLHEENRGVNSLVVQIGRYF